MYPSRAHTFKCHYLHGRLQCPSVSCRCHFYTDCNQRLSMSLPTWWLTINILEFTNKQQSTLEHANTSYKTAYNTICSQTFSMQTKPTLSVNSTSYIVVYNTFEFTNKQQSPLEHANPFYKMDSYNTSSSQTFSMQIKRAQSVNATSCRLFHNIVTLTQIYKRERQSNTMLQCRLVVSEV